MRFLDGFQSVRGHVNLNFSPLFQQQADKSAEFSMVFDDKDRKRQQNTFFVELLARESPACARIFLRRFLRKSRSRATKNLLPIRACVRAIYEKDHEQISGEHHTEANRFLHPSRARVFPPSFSTSHRFAEEWKQ